MPLFVYGKIARPSIVGDDLTGDEGHQMAHAPYRRLARDGINACQSEEYIVGSVVTGVQESDGFGGRVQDGCCQRGTDRTWVGCHLQS